ncbi:hypothetical protein [Tenacibaculum aiptasiae]|uniref:hypothetical protein n=1 Tax=Tenacibaculum aiptasiae TaxID=426481 RepID=UPI00232B696B|nr:hypothetical protein [Tenacibaculum aiptasiae]
MSKVNYKDKFKYSEFISERIKDSKEDLISGLEEKAERDKNKLIKKLDLLSNDQKEDLFLKYIPLQRSMI